MPPNPDVPDAFINAVQRYTPDSSGTFAAQLLWQRGIQTVEALIPFADPDAYHPTSPDAFGEEMEWAIARLTSAYHTGETIAIWGDFDADGVTATSVLWDGLGQFFPQGDRLSYLIPNRLKESHGLSIAGLDTLAEKGVTLIITCDTGSTNLVELDHARSRGMDVIVTDHHTLPPQRPNVTAIINPRSLSADHALAHLSGVAVAYKLVEALYEVLPDVPQMPLEHLLDLVAIGLIADLVELKGDCRYLAQVGIERLQTQIRYPTRPGIAALLNLCRRTGDRPTDISFGIGPRINAISRIYGDAHFCVDLLTSTDADLCRKLAEDTEMANLRRKALQRDVVNQVTVRLAELDVSTTEVIVLVDAQWPVGILGLVAGQIAQDYNRPTILLTHSEGQEAIARGSARSVNGIDLYDLVNSQSHLLLGFGGHPFAAGLSLRADDVSLFTDAINQEFRARYGSAIAQTPTLQADLTVHVSDLGQALFRELNLLEPYGMGNPIPRLLIQNCWFENVWHKKIQDLQNRKLNYIKTTFKVWDDSVQQGFPGSWWGHYKDELPEGRCDALVELDYNSAPNGKTNAQYEVRLIAVRPSSVASPYQDRQTGTRSGDAPSLQLLDWRIEKPNDEATGNLSQLTPIAVDDRPATWQQFYDSLIQAQVRNAPLAIAFPPPVDQTPENIWKTLVGIAKYLTRTQHTTTTEELQHALGMGWRSLQLGFTALNALGFRLTVTGQDVAITYLDTSEDSSEQASGNSEESHALYLIQVFMAAVGEEQFRQRFFHEIPASTLKAAADQFLQNTQ